jgi:hypothetical protein
MNAEPSVAVAPYSDGYGRGGSRHEGWPTRLKSSAARDADSECQGGRTSAIILGGWDPATGAGVASGFREREG